MRTLALLISATLLLSSCMSRSDDAPAGSSQNTQSIEVKYQQVLDQTSSKIRDTAEFQTCMAPSVRMCITQVGNDLARKTKSVDFCNEMPDDASRDACKFGVVMTQAVESGNKKLCETLSPTYKSSCMTSMITQSARASGDVRECDALAGSGQDNGKAQCYVTVIMQNPASTEEDCQKIDEEREQERCESFLRTRNRSNLNQ